MDSADSDNAVGQGLRQASALLRAGSVDSALALLARLDRDHPDRTEVRSMRGIVLARGGRLEEAEILLRSVADRSPGSAGAAGDHAQVLLGLGRPYEALERLESARGSRSPGDLGLAFAFNLGMALKGAGRAAEAVEPLRRVVCEKPGQYDALVALGDVHKALGQLGEAADRYREAIRSQPDLGTAWWSLANLKAGGFSDAETTELARRTAAPAREPSQQVYFEFALADALDARDRTDEAWAHYVQGNRLKRAGEPWYRDRYRRWLAQLRDAMAGTQLPDRRDPPGEPRPVFIVSLPRSGSTLTEQILAAHSRVTAAGELPWLPRLVADQAARAGRPVVDWAATQSAGDWLRFGTAYMEKCADWRRQSPVFTDKLPGNLPFIGAMLAMHPDALVVGVRRDPMDVCWSCYRQLFISGSEFSYDLEDLAAYWKDADRHLEYWRERAPRRVRVLDYEALVTEPEREIRALLDFLALPFEPACLRPQDARRAVATASAAQVRQPIHAAGLGHWQRYRQQLAGLAAEFGR